MPTILAFAAGDVRAIYGGYEGAWRWEDGNLTVAQEETLAKVLQRVDPDLQVLAASAAFAAGAPQGTVVSRAFAAGDRLRGVILTSDRAVRWSLQVDGVERAAFRTEAAQPGLPVNLPGSLAAGGATVRVQALNESDQGIATCDAALLWYTPTEA